MPEPVEASSPPDDHEMHDVEVAAQSPAEGPPAKKRKRSVKPNPDKKYDCKHEGCTKSYSRAEHLHRHQLNHTPKKIYRCDYPDCNRWFVRQDLCIRHRERHSTHGSQIYKRDTFVSSSSPPNGMHLPDAMPADRSAQQSISTNGEFYSGNGQPGAQFDRAYRNSSNAQQVQLPGSLSESTTSNEPFKPPTPPAIRPTPALYRSRSISSNPFSPEHREPSMSLNGQIRHDSFGSRTQESPSHALGESTFATQQPPQPARSYFPVRPGAHLSNHRNAVSSASNAAFAAAVSQGLNSVHTDPLVPYPILGNDSGMDSSIPFDYPIFGENEYTRSPFAMADDFTAWLFNENQSAMTFPTAPTQTFTYTDGFVPSFQGPGFSTGSMRSSHTMKMTNILSPSASGQYVPIMSEEKRQELLHMMSTVFIERPHDAVKKRKESVFEGDVDADGHILSLRMMHTYIGSYWYHQHAQMPILHKPTFSADKTPNLLLLIVIAIGAATMDKAYGTSLTDSAAEFANFVVWHLRWEIVRDADFRPPAKLWVFQTLLLIEVYEKMYATRALHERAHIHHDSTLTLMRRGSSLLGRAASESPPGLRERKISLSGNSSATEADKSEEQWHQWITTEATRRAAFGAFVLDSIHATMFGHSAKMVAHEMRLPLPCDEGLWSASSPGEAGRVQTALETNGVKPMLFLEGLKKTFLGDRVRTNSFGRTILMAGLLSVSWHMTQRDLQITSLGTKAAGDNFGRRDIWKGPLLRAFDNWKVEFDRALGEALPSTPDQVRVQNSGSVSMLRPVDDENIFESRTVLHHLAHIAAHVDILDCQVFAGATRLLGRSVSPKDYTMVREKIKKWASKASARDAAFYALKFLAQVLIPPDDEDGKNSTRYGHASPILPQAFEGNQYIARDDFLLNRPWVLFISTLVVWCYGFALEGPLIPRPSEFDFTTYDSRDQDMRAYLDRVGGINAPDDLEHVKGKNQCLGLLMILKDSFSLTRWELTHEAANLLGNCIERLKGVEGDGYHTGGQMVPKNPYKMENGRHARIGNGGV